MATISDKIQTPVAAQIVQEVINVTVSAQAQKEGVEQSATVDSVTVTFGTGGPAIKATPAGVGLWSCSGTISSTAPNGPLTITAVAEGTYVGPKLPPGEPPDTGPIDPPATDAVTVTVNIPPPVLSVNIQTNVSTATPPYLLSVTGSLTPGSNLTPIASFQYQLNSGSWVNIPKNSSNSWNPWQINISFPLGSNSITFVAKDSRGASPSAAYTVNVEEPIPVILQDQAFVPTTYLRELLAFAHDQILAPPKPTPQLFAQQFFQPFDTLTVIPQDSQKYQQGIAPIHQARIAIEVLRHQMASVTPPIAVPADTDQRYRLLAYQTILREIGTSYDELRLARVAATAVRTSLAARIGLQLGTTRPDNLDQITLMGAAITDAALETLFGYRSTSPADSLAPPSSDQSSLLVWQLASLTSAWRFQDAQARDTATGALPLIDPDIVGIANFTVPTASNPAFALWTARTNWINTTLAQITSAGAAQTLSPALLSQLIAKYIGSIDMAGLATTDANGGDISATLSGFNLDLDAFRFLVLCLQLLAAGTLLDSELQDIFAILLETQKRSQFKQWRLQETQAGLVLAPAYFQTNAGGTPPEIPMWRGDSATYSDWQRTLEGRIGQLQTTENDLAAAIEAAEQQTLPALRDALLRLIGQRQTPPEAVSVTAERLSRQLQIDFLTNAGPAVTRVDQAIDTLQGILFSVRAGQLTAAGTLWELDPSAKPAFDAAWVTMGTFTSWLAATNIFAYPENLLAPNLYNNSSLTPTQSFLNLVSDLRGQIKLSPNAIANRVFKYLSDLSGDKTALSTTLGLISPPLAPPLPSLTNEMTDAQLLLRKTAIQTQFGSNPNPSDPSLYPLFEAFWLVPMTVAFCLQGERQYLAALDWFRSIYAYNLPLAARKIYYGLTLEENIPKTIPTRDPAWLTDKLNPHVFALTLTDSSGTVTGGRPNAYTSYTVLSIVQCLLAYADQEFARGTTESISEARSLYETAADLLQNPPDVATPADPNAQFPPNPIWAPLLSHAQSNLTKIRSGMNIAGVLIAPSSATVFLPSQYPYTVLINRAKNLVGIAQQVESSYLSALEQKDVTTYSALQASNDLKVAAASVILAQKKVTDAADGVTAAQLQQNKTNVEYNHYDTLIGNGLSGSEKAGLAALSLTVAYSAANFDILNPGASLVGAANAAAALAEKTASYERRNEEWQYQRNLADQDRQIAAQQHTVAQDQQAIAIQEQSIASLQQDNATQVVTFLTNKFTNAELFDWMSGVLGQVYAHFLQQAAAIAQVAEAQLAFERQTPPSGYIRSDYWQNTADSADGAARQGLTGAEQLLQDIDQLDEYAFESDVRTLHITQTFSAAQIAALELQQLRDTGILVLATPMSLFDQDFPGHYLRLIQSVQVSIIALVSPVRGIRGTLSASGLSGVVVPTNDQFQTVTLGRAPESFSFTSPTNANGLFDVETDTSGLLLPFQGMGVDTVWQLELPKAANPFDFRAISDVQLTIKYTALSSGDYREQVIRSLDNTFSGDQTFSLVNDYPDAWYLLNNPSTVADVASQMKVTITVAATDFPPNISQLTIQQVSIYCLRKDGATQELNVVSLSLTSAGGAPTVTSTGALQTIGGVMGTRRPAGIPWVPFIGQNPVGNWTLQLDNTDAVKALFTNGTFQDIALVLTIGGTTPAWP